MWNNLPEEVVTSPSINCFKGRFDRWQRGAMFSRQKDLQQWTSTAVFLSLQRPVYGRIACMDLKKMMLIIIFLECQLHFLRISACHKLHLGFLQHIRTIRKKMFCSCCGSSINVDDFFVRTAARVLWPLHQASARVHKILTFLCSEQASYS